MYSRLAMRYMHIIIYTEIFLGISWGGRGDQEQVEEEEFRFWVVRVPFSRPINKLQCKRFMWHISTVFDYHRKPPSPPPQILKLQRSGEPIVLNTISNQQRTFIVLSHKCFHNKFRNGILRLLIDTWCWWWFCSNFNNNPECSVALKARLGHMLTLDTVPE